MKNFFYGHYCDRWDTLLLPECSTAVIFFLFVFVCLVIVVHKSLVYGAQEVQNKSRF